jgi:hypothetical protein
MYGGHSLRIGRVSRRVGRVELAQALLRHRRMNLTTVVVAFIVI